MPDTVPGDVTTTAAITFSTGFGHAASAVETLGDTDWHRIQLTAGVTYEFHLSLANGATLGDPLLRLLDGAGVELAMDDNSGIGTDARLTFVAPASGTFFLEVSGKSGIGDYTLVAVDRSVFTAAPSFGDNNENYLTGAVTATLIAGAGNDILSGDPGIAIGDSGDDVITGGASDNKLVGSEGNDLLAGAAGNDQLFGDAGIDDLRGGAGNDLLHGGAGNDRIDGGAGFDIADYTGDTRPLVATIAATTHLLVGNAIVESAISIEGLVGGSGTDTFTGNSAANVLNGALGNDALTGNAGLDTLVGGDGNDLLTGGADNDVIVGSGGNDVATYSDKFVPIAVTLNGDIPVNVFVGGVAEDLILGVEGIHGGDDADTINGDGLANLFRGGDGNDTLVGGGGIDTADFSDQFATVTVTLDGANPVSATIAFLNQVDTLSAFENVIGGSGRDFLTGDGGANRLDGGSSDDVLSGGAGPDTLLGGNFNDTLVGGAGADRMEGGGGSFDTDVVDYSAETSALTVLLNGGAEVTVFAGGATDTLLDIDGAFGGSGNDTLAGDANANLFRGGGGNDTLTGAGGNDTADYQDKTSGISVALNGAAAVLVTMTGGEVDTIAAMENVTGGSGADTITGDSLPNALGGGNANDTLTGGAGNDTLTGGAGVDLLTGGDGNDSYVNPASDQIVELATADAGTADRVLSETSFTLASLPNIEQLTLTGNFANISGTGNALDNLILGNSGDNQLAGGDGNDTLSGVFGNDTLIGGVGVDTLSGGSGNDTYVNPLGDAIDETSLGSSGTGDRVQSFQTFTLPDGVEHLTLTGAAAIDGAGNAAANALTGNAAVNRLTGADGDDTLIGGGGRDTLDGGVGVDTIFFAGLADSTGMTRDVIVALKFDIDRLAFPGLPAAIAPMVTTGTLNEGAGFDASLEAAIGAGQLGADQAVLFDPSAGTANFNATLYLIVDANAVAGYQAGQDFVVQLSNPSGTLTVDSFT